MACVESRGMRYDDPRREAPPEDISNTREVMMLLSLSLSTPARGEIEGVQ
jgi:hypothetical protein